jgi:hypothetical protein
LEIVYQLVGYNRETERQVASYLVSPSLASDAKLLAGLSASDDGLGDYQLNPDQAQQVARRLGIEIDPQACDYFLEPQVKTPRKYPLPDFLKSSTTQARYEHWLHGRAVAHVKRDRKRGNVTATNESYKKVIHQAVLDSKLTDYYTGELLDWSLLSRYSNDEAGKNKRRYKASLALLPSVDHVGDGLGAPDLKICAWRTNDAKNDLTPQEFIDLCRRVVAHYEAEAGNLAEHDIEE